MAARDGHSEINNVEESHLLILPLIGEWSLHGFADSFTAAADKTKDEQRGKKKKKKKKDEEKGARKEKGQGGKGEGEQREEMPA